MKNMGGSTRNSIVEKLAFLGAQGTPWGVIFRWLKFSLILCVISNGDSISRPNIYVVSSRNLNITLPVPLWSLGPGLKVISKMISFISFCGFCRSGPGGHKSILCVLNGSFIFEISVYNQLETDLI